MTDLQVFHDLSVALVRLMTDEGTSKHISYVDEQDDVDVDTGKCYKLEISLTEIPTDERK